MDPLLMSCHLHWPLKALPADIAPMCLDREVCSADVVAQRFRIFELRGADVTHAGLTAIHHGLLNGRVQNILHHFAVASVFG